MHVGNDESFGTVDNFEPVSSPYFPYVTFVIILSLPCSISWEHVRFPYFPNTVIWRQLEEGNFVVEDERFGCRYHGRQLGNM